MDSYSQSESTINIPDYNTFTVMYNIRLNKPIFNIVEPSSVEADETCIVTDKKEIKKLEKESTSKEGRRQALRDIYGLTEHWDYEFLD